MKTFIEFIKEREETGTFEIPTMHARKYKKSLERAGLTVKIADDEGLVVVGSKEKLRQWLTKNEWDPEEIKSLLS